VVCLTTYLDLESLEIRRSGFDFKSNLTSAIDDLANHDIQQDMFPTIMPWPMTEAIDAILWEVGNSLALLKGA
jgi:hypothetical protein